MVYPDEFDVRELFDRERAPAIVHKLLVNVESVIAELEMALL